ncbi:peptidase C14 [Gonapodya prolifera JEL478]|uniref:Peptidase C14 n=1 Tax=Gonapodya prolifera (strain JEL478) TaxID=1344416 RepID=A0A139AEB7_GONPJ|nr:peptidase C14 [Gonapodya prolifera JEL478]|eukprot:KXS14785.1 peptidase C14 [Gonapodya prolifera JEL478]
MGNKKALLIGINYRGSGQELKGCINDVAHMYEYLTQSCGYSKDKMVVMTEDATNPNFLPNSRNIIAGFRWLVRDNRPGDTLFLHYSGHGSQVQDPVDSRPDHPDFDDTIVPLDYKQAGQITSTQLHKMLVSPLPQGVKLTVIFDCCHSGTMLELPYTFRPDAKGNVSVHKFTEYAKSAISNGKIAFNKHAPLQTRIAAAKDLFSDRAAQAEAGAGQIHDEEEFTDDWGHENKVVYCYSGCMDEQTSADTKIAGTPVGAMSWALLSVLHQNPRQSYSDVLRNTRQMLANKYSQIPQLSVGRQDANLNEIISF